MSVNFVISGKFLVSPQRLLHSIDNFQIFSLISNFLIWLLNTKKGVASLHFPVGREILTALHQCCFEGKYTASTFLSFICTSWFRRKNESFNFLILFIFKR